MSITSYDGSVFPISSPAARVDKNLGKLRIAQGASTTYAPETHSQYLKFKQEIANLRQAVEKKGHTPLDNPQNSPLTLFP